MKSNKQVGRDRKVLLSTLWIFAMFNYIYADLFGVHYNALLQPEFINEYATGQIGAIQITEGFALVTAILMETAIAMVLLSRVLNYKANRWANIIVGVVHTAAVFASLFAGNLTLFYIFFATIEIACTLFIIGYAWKWANPEV
jgi:hypothetical protein